MARPWQDAPAAAERAFTPNCARNRHLLSRKRDSRVWTTPEKTWAISGLRCATMLARSLQKACGPKAVVREGRSSR